MAEVCPHCRAKLPPVRDAFCPECRNALDEVPLRVQPRAPTDDERDYAGSPVQGASRQRLPGISILAVLHFVGGIILGALQFSLLAKLDQLEEPLRLVGLSPVLVVVGTTFLALLNIAAGIGMWLGRKWGWWLGSFYYVYAIARNGSALLTLTALEDELAGSTRGPEYYYVKYAARIVVHLLIGLYLFQGNVLRYFGLEGLSKWKAISALVGACLAICGVVSVIASFAP